MAELTTNYYINQANSFIEDVNDTRNSYYVFAARPQPWDNEASPPQANDSVEQTSLSVYRDLLFGKLIANSDVYSLIPRYDWTANTVYAQYDQNDPDLYSKQFYVINDQYQVYKCIYNNRGANSTVEPRLTSPEGTFSTADGYIWKYMYTVDPSANAKFTTSDYIPVKTDPAVSGNAVSGTIDAYSISNGGSGYAVTETGFINAVVDKFTIQLPSTSSANDNHYTKSSIYLKSGFGAGQVREISSYNGATKQVRVSTFTPFDTFTRLDFTSAPSGTLGVGYFAEQVYDTVTYLFISNNQAFTVGSNVVQSDTGLTGTILTANSSVLRIAKANTSATFQTSPTLPIRDASQDGTLRTGTVSITTNSNTVTGVGTTFTNTTTGYVVGNYIRVGANTTSQIRRITAVANDTQLSVSQNFTETLVANVHYFVPLAAEPVSAVISRANGTISNTNLQSVRLTISNPVLPGTTLIVGEAVTQVDVANTYQGANAVVAFANSSTVYLSGVNGSWQTGLYILGASSLQRNAIASVDSTPNITLRDPSGQFILGFPVDFKVNSSTSIITGNGSPISITTLPNDQTEYEIAPTVVVEGDGSNATAIAVVNTAFGSANDVVAIQVIDPGKNYTYATATIYANTSFGTGAQAIPVIAPVGGHGKDALYELGARYVGVSTTFDNGSNEGLAFPTYGEFRRVGILQNPEFADLRVTLKDFDHVNLTINNKVTASSNVSITTWYPGEVVVQPSTNAAGLVVEGNNTFLQLKNVLGTFQASNAQIIGYYSNTTANCFSADIVRFEVTSDSLAEVISQVGSGAVGEVVQVLSNTEVVLSNVVGKFVSGDTMVLPTVNAYAVVNSISTANGSRDVTSSFGNKFNQTMRLTLTANNGAYVNNEVVVQDLTNASAVVVSDRDEVDLSITINSGTFTVGQTVQDASTGATGIITSSNSTYIKLTAASQNTSFTASSILNNDLGANATITAVYPVLLLNNVDGPNRFQAGSNAIIGQTSGASGTCNSYDLILYPELNRDTGRVVYVDNFQPVTRSPTSKEEIRLVIKF